MSISEISAVRLLPLRSSALISAIAACAFGPGARRSEASSCSESPLTTGTSGTTACGARPRSRPSSSSQWRRLPWTSVKGRRSSTLITTWFGNSRTTSARRTSGSAVTRPATACVSRPRMLVPGAIEAAARICSTGRREAPRTSTLATASRGVVRSQRAPSAAPAASRRTSAATGRIRTSRRRRRRRRDPRPIRWPATNVERSPRSRSVAGRALGETRPLGILFPDAPDLGLERQAEVGLHALPREIHQRHDVARRRAAPVHDEVGVLGRDLRAVDPLALEPALLDEPGRDLALRVLPDAAGRRERERLGRLLLLQAYLDVFLDLADRSAREAEPAADQHRARRRMEGAEGERAGGGLELAERAVRVQKVHRAHEVADPAVRRARVHGERAADRGRDPDQAFDAAEVRRRRLADERREAHDGARGRLLAVELGAPQAALEAQHDAADAAVLHEQVVAAADHRHGQLLAVGEEQGVSDVVHVLRDHEDVGGAADAQRGMEAQGLLEPDFPPDLS